MSKFISKQSVAIWYVLSALLATFIVGKLSFGVSQTGVVWVPHYCLS